MWSILGATSFAKWKALLFLRAVAISVYAIMADFEMRRNPAFYPLLFTSLKISNNYLTSFGVPLYTGKDIKSEKTLINAYIWISNIVLILTCIVLWNETIISTKQFNIGQPSGLNRVALSCDRGWSCYYFDPNRYTKGSDLVNIFKSWFNWQMDDFCSISDSIRKGNSVFNIKDMHNTNVACFLAWPSDFIETVIKIVVAIITGSSLYFIFDCFVTIHLRQRTGTSRMGAALGLLMFISLIAFIYQFVISMFYIRDVSGDIKIIIFCMIVLQYQAYRAGVAIKSLNRTSERRSTAKLFANIN